MTDWAGLRKKWTTARDAAKVKKGAVSKVSMGDAIDLVHKSFPKGMAPTMKAAKDLVEDCKIYTKALSAKHSGLCDWLKKNVQDPAQDLHDALSDDLDNLGKIYKVLMRDTTAPFSGCFPTEGSIKNAIQAARKSPNTPFPDIAKETGLYTIGIKIMAVGRKKIQAWDNMKWKSPLPGFDAQFKKIRTYLDHVEEDFAFSENWMKSATLESFSDQSKIAVNRSTALSDYDPTVSAFEKIAGKSLS